MAQKERSPNYPAIDPGEALSDAKALWAKHSRAAMTPEEAAIALGYKGLSGASRPRLAALKKYGILEKRGKGLALTVRAICIAVRSEESQQYKEAVRDAILEVDLFRHLLSNYDNATERMVQEHLITDRSFTPDGASKAASAFFAAKQLLQSVGASTLEKEEADGEDRDSESDDDDAETSGGRGETQKSQRGRKDMGISENQTEHFISLVGDGSLTIIAPRRIQPRNRALLEAWIKSVLDDMFNPNQERVPDPSNDQDQ